MTQIPDFQPEPPNKYSYLDSSGRWINLGWAERFSLWLGNLLMGNNTSSIDVCARRTLENLPPIPDALHRLSQHMDDNQTDVEVRRVFQRAIIERAGPRLRPQLEARMNVGGKLFLSSDEALGIQLPLIWKKCGKARTTLREINQVVRDQGQSLGEDFDNLRAVWRRETADKTKSSVIRFYRDGVNVRVPNQVVGDMGRRGAFVTIQIAGIRITEQQVRQRAEKLEENPQLEGDDRTGERFCNALVELITEQIPGYREKNPSEKADTITRILAGLSAVHQGYDAPVIAAMDQLAFVTRNGMRTTEVVPGSSSLHILFTVDLSGEKLQTYYESERRVEYVKNGELFREFVYRIRLSLQPDPEDGVVLEVNDLAPRANLKRIIRTGKGQTFWRGEDVEKIAEAVDPNSANITYDAYEKALRSERVQPHNHATIDGVEVVLPDHLLGEIGRSQENIWIQLPGMKRCVRYTIFDPAVNNFVKETKRNQNEVLTHMLERMLRALPGYASMSPAETEAAVHTLMRGLWSVTVSHTAPIMSMLAREGDSLHRGTTLKIDYRSLPSGHFSSEIAPFGILLKGEKELGWGVIAKVDSARPHEGSVRIFVGPPISTANPLTKEFRSALIVRDLGALHKEGGALL